MIINEIQKENYLRLAEVLIHLEQIYFKIFENYLFFFLQVYEKLRSIF